MVSSIYSLSFSSSLSLTLSLSDSNPNQRGALVKEWLEELVPQSIVADDLSNLFIVATPAPNLLRGKKRGCSFSSSPSFCLFVSLYLLLFIFITLSLSFSLFQPLSLSHSLSLLKDQSCCITLNQERN
jgi:hypothetical protein